MAFRLTLTIGREAEDALQIGFLLVPLYRTVHGWVLSHSTV